MEKNIKASIVLLGKFMSKKRRLTQDQEYMPEPTYDGLLIGASSGVMDRVKRRKRSSTCTSYVESPSDSGAEVAAAPVSDEGA